MFFFIIKTTFKDAHQIAGQVSICEKLYCARILFCSKRALTILIVSVVLLSKFLQTRGKTLLFSYIKSHLHSTHATSTHVHPVLIFLVQFAKKEKKCFVCVLNLKTKCETHVKVLMIEKLNMIILGHFLRIRASLKHVVAYVEVEVS